MSYLLYATYWKEKIMSLTIRVRLEDEKGKERTSWRIELPRVPSRGEILDVQFRNENGSDGRWIVMEVIRVKMIVTVKHQVPPVDHPEYGGVPFEEVEESDICVFCIERDKD